LIAEAQFKHCGPVFRSTDGMPLTVRQQGWQRLERAALTVVKSCNGRSTIADQPNPISSTRFQAKSGTTSLHVHRSVHGPTLTSPSWRWFFGSWGQSGRDVAVRLTLTQDPLRP
jgi:hypothetical protein